MNNTITSNLRISKHIKKLVNDLLEGPLPDFILDSNIHKVITYVLPHDYVLEFWEYVNYSKIIIRNVITKEEFELKNSIVDLYNMINYWDARSDVPKNVIIGVVKILIEIQT